MSLDAYIFIDHTDGTPHCEVARSGEPVELEEQHFEYLDSLLKEVGEETAPFIGDTAVRLGSEGLVEVLPDVGVLCKVHQVADPSEPHAADINDYFVGGGSLI